MADPICRWRNASVSQLLEFNSLIPKSSTLKDVARIGIEANWNFLGNSSFFTTAYQLAVQMGLYYEEDNIFYPRFTKILSIEEGLNYLKDWCKRYYAPNPYTKSMTETEKPVVINDFLVNWVIEHETPLFSEALSGMFKERLGNTDILKNMLNNFSDVEIDEDRISLKEGVSRDKRENVILEGVNKNDKKYFFEHFGGKTDKNNCSVKTKEIYSSSNIADFMGTCLTYYLEYDVNMSKTVPSIKKNSVTIGFKKCPFGKTVESQDAVTDPRRMDDCDKGIKWSYQDVDYYFLKEQATGTLEIFAAAMNKIYGDKYIIEIKGRDYCLYEIILSTSTSTEKCPLQQIFYGAPGTGKSDGIKRKEKDFSEVIRTTFHPDSDYATFVGAYKPVMKKVRKCVVIGKEESEIKTSVTKDDYEEKISYSFVKQAFLKAYISAWQGLNEQNKVLLVIEEINRGNCAQIFGDLFQLLDRETEGENRGYSTYPIVTDEDLREVLAEDFKDIEGIPENVKSGENLLLPPNLHIWATMNTSDQSLFPIDSAFKRRWDWVYKPIKYENKDWKVVLADGRWCKWTDLQQTLNDLIYDATESEDKMLGDWFVKAENNVISEEVLVGKIIFYLWNDVAKVDAGKLFDLEVEKNGRKPRKVIFSDFYNADGTINSEIVKNWLKKISVTLTEKETTAILSTEDA